MLKEWKSALIASLISGAIFATFTHVFSSGGEIYFDPAEIDRVHEMPYGEAIKHLNERVYQINRWQSFSNAVRYEAFWFGYLADIVFYAMIGFVSCLVFHRLRIQGEKLE